MGFADEHDKIFQKLKEISALISCEVALYEAFPELMPKGNGQDSLRISSPVIKAAAKMSVIPSVSQSLRDAGTSTSALQTGGSPSPLSSSRKSSTTASQLRRTSSATDDGRAATSSNVSGSPSLT